MVNVTGIAAILADGRHVSIHCNTAIDSIFDNKNGRIGHATLETGKIVYQYGWCKNIMEYMSHPKRITRDELVSLSLFTHEAMHIRGERNEQKTECQTIQNNYRAAKLLGIPDHLAKKHAIDYYRLIYLIHHYYSRKCTQGNEAEGEPPNPIWDNAK